MAKRAAIGNNKGGTGKSAATVNLAAALADSGRKVLIVDLDPQANTSRRVGRPFRPDDPTVTVSEVIHANTEGCAADGIVPVAWPKYQTRIDVLPARFDLENRISEAAVLGAVGRLRRAMVGVDDEHDVTLFDLPPSLGHLTQLGLAAAHVALCTVEPEFDGVEGGLRFCDFVEGQADELKNPGLRIAGILVSRLRANTSGHSHHVESLPGLFGDRKVWRPHIPERTAIKDAADEAIPLSALNNSRANEVRTVYADLAVRLCKELGV